MLRSFIQTRALSASASRNSFARLNILGTVGNVQIREKKDSDEQFVTFSLAVNPYKKDGEYVTEWYNLSAFSPAHVSFFDKYVLPGSKLYVEADYKQKAIVDESGEKRYFPQITVKNFDVVSLKKAGDSESE